MSWTQGGRGGGHAALTNFPGLGWWAERQMRGRGVAGTAHYLPDLGWWAERQVMGRGWQVENQSSLTIPWDWGSTVGYNKHQEKGMNYYTSLKTKKRVRLQICWECWVLNVHHWSWLNKNSQKSILKLILFLLTRAENIQVVCQTLKFVHQRLSLLRKSSDQHISVEHHRAPCSYRWKRWILLFKDRREGYRLLKLGWSMLRPPGQIRIC